jgi:hypothetical protein
LKEKKIFTFAPASEKSEAEEFIEGMIKEQVKHRKIFGEFYLEQRIFKIL